MAVGVTVPRVTAIVVTWNSAGVIADCLASLRDSVIPGGVKTIVVDNGSADAKSGALNTKSAS